MERLPVGAAPPPWFVGCSTTAAYRPHYILRDPAMAPTVEVLGSRFLRRYHLETAPSNKAIPWQLRFPRVTKWCEAGDGPIVDTVETFRAKALEAWAATAPGTETPTVASQTALALLSSPPPDQTQGWGAQDAPQEWYQQERRQVAAEQQQPSYRSATAAGGMLTAGGGMMVTQRPSHPAASSSAGSPGQAKWALVGSSTATGAARSAHSARSAPAEQDWDTGESGDNLERLREAQEQQKKQRRR